MRHLILAVALAATAFQAHAQDATNGQTLYTSAVVAGKQTCASAACHGVLPGNPQNRIANGISAPDIKRAIGSISQMSFLSGRLTDAQLNNLSAYIAGKLGGSPTYLAVAAAPSPSVNPGNLSFPGQALRSASAAQTVTLSNATGATAALVVGSIATTSGSDYAVSGGTCATGASIAAGASCTVAITFTPTAAGTRSGTLSIGHNGSGGASTVSLSGTGVDNSPAITLSPTQLPFTQTVGDTSDPLRVTIGNGGTADLVLSSITVSGGSAGDYAIASGSTCGAGTRVASGSNCYVELRFTPTATGARSATLVIQHNASTGTSSVALNGQGNATAQPGFVLDATALDLGAQGIGITGAARTVTITNNGQADLQFTAISAGGAQAAEIVLGGTCAVGTPVAAKASCTVTAALHPGELGARSATLSLATNAAIGTATISLSGEGIASPAPALVLSQPSLGFGMVTIGATSIPRSVTVSNSGSAALLFSGIQSASSEFKATHNCPASLAPGESCTITVTYTPASANAAESVVITSNAFSSPNSIALTGLGTTTVLPVLTWNGVGSSLNFAATEVGKSLDASALMLVNNGPGSVTISAIGTAGANADAFAIGGGTCLGGISLVVGASCTVVVSFVPDAAGARSAVLLVASNGSNPPDIPLAGTGVAGSTGGGGGGSGGDGGSTGGATGTLAVTPAVLDYRSIVVRSGGRSEPLVVRISNTSATAATIASVTTTVGFVVEPASAADACPGVPWTLASGASCTVAVIFTPGSGGSAVGSLHVLSATGQAVDVQLSAEAQTVMTNQGGGALGPLWLCALAIAVVAAHSVRRRAGSPHN